VGWTTLQRAGETDAAGNYCIEHVRPAYVDLFGFAHGFVYFHGHPIAIRAGKTVVYSFRMPHETFPATLQPILSNATITPEQVSAGGIARFTVHVRPGQPGKMSPEVFALNGRVGRSVLLEHRGNGIYSGTLRVPRGTRAATYTFSFAGAMENCLENVRYPSATLTVIP
jgi:hypothetical protein